MTAPLVIRRAAFGGRVVDIRCQDGRITALGAGVEGADVEHDAAGGAVVPGLHDHHIHLLALAAARASVSVEDVDDAATFDACVRAAVAAAAPSAWIRIVGYHESPMGPLDAARLDALAPATPVRVQHQTGAMWVWNSPALTTAGVDRWTDIGVERDAGGRPTGRLFGLDARLRAVAPASATDVAAVGRELAGCGVVGVTDLTPTTDPSSVALLAGHAGACGFPLDVTITGGLELVTDVAPELPRGPVKLIAADHDLPGPDELAAAITTAHHRGRPVAVHCASRVGLVVALVAFEEAGARPGDRVEHGAVVPVDVIPRLRALRLTVVTQPSFVERRGDRYLREHTADEHDDLWRCGSLLRAGVGVAAGSDAPYGAADPWVAIAAAVSRRTSGGRLLAPDERISAAQALAMWLTTPDAPAGPPRRVAVGEPARLCVLDRPLADALRTPSRTAVRATVGRAGWVDA